jgi:hypothetical protein
VMTPEAVTILRTCRQILPGKKVIETSMIPGWVGLGLEFSVVGEARLEIVLAVFDGRGRPCSI